MKPNFTANNPNQLWVTDIAEHLLMEGTVYACVVLDAFSRKAVGWAIDRRANTTLVNQAPHMACSTREALHGIITHADHGTQFTAFTGNADKYGLRLSLGTVGVGYVRTMIDCFRARMQTELLDWRKWPTIVELRTKVAHCIDTFHNHQRSHSSLDVLTPTE